MVAINRLRASPAQLLMTCEQLLEAHHLDLELRVAAQATQLLVTSIGMVVGVLASFMQADVEAASQRALATINASKPK